jgi:carbon monoxide dehydrogenase subunit G
MELSHSFTVPADVDLAWATFMDLQRVGGCFPGAVVTEVTDDGFSGTVKVKLGPIALQYGGSGAFVERDDGAHRAVIEAKGKDKRGNGTAGATVTIQLTADGAGTRADVSTDLAVTGKPAQFGRGIMQDVSDKLLQQFVTCIESQFDAETPEPGVSDAATDTPEASAEPAAQPDRAVAVETAEPAAQATPAAPLDDAAPTRQPGSANGMAPPKRTSAPVSRVVSESSADDALDLGATVLPIMLKTYGPYAVAGLVGVVLGILLGRRRSR